METLEFARIVAILIEHVEARCALIANRTDLSREQQQKREHRDEFGETIVARLFNDQSVKVGLVLGGLVSREQGLGNIDFTQLSIVPRTES